MRYLLDTHIALWLLSGDDRLPIPAKEIAISGRNELYLSVISIWEVTIKHRKSPDQMPISGQKLAFYCDKAGIVILPVLREHVLTVDTLQRSVLDPPHNDPFDRLLIAQSKWEGITLITHDRLFAHYHEPTVWTV